MEAVRIIYPDGRVVIVDANQSDAIQEHQNQGGVLEMDGVNPRIYTSAEELEQASTPPPGDRDPLEVRQQASALPYDPNVGVAPSLVYQGQGMQTPTDVGLAIGQKNQQAARQRDRAALSAEAFPDYTIPQPGDYNVAAGDTGPTQDQFAANYNDRTGETTYSEGYNPFEGTWAENEGLSVYNQIGSGQMTPDYAIQRMLGAQGITNHGQQGYLEEMYTNYPEYYKMLNPGAEPLTPHEQYGIGGDYINQLTEPSNGYAVLDPRLMWDNTFAGENDPRYKADATASDQPWVDQHQMVRQRIVALLPIIGEDNAMGLLNQTDLLWRQYQDMQNSGQTRPDYSFIDFMRDNGAGDWF